MEKLDNKIIVVNGEKQLLNDYLGKLIYLDSQSVVDYFKKLKMTLPRFLRMEALKSTLEPILSAEKQRLQETVDSGDPNRMQSMQRMNRLVWCESFSEFELEEELVSINDSEAERIFLLELWRNILIFLVEVPVLDDVFVDLANLAMRKFDENVIPKVKQFNKAIDDLFFDAPNEIDGLTVEQFRSVVTRCSTVKELLKMGEKYHIKVPKTVKKAELQEMIFKEMERRGALTEPLRKEMLSFTVKELEEFAAANDIVASTYFTKEMIVEYILKHAESTKAHYYVPEETTPPTIVPPVVVTLIKEEPIKEEPIKEEPIKEEPVKEEPVKEEPVKEEPIKEEPIKEKIKVEVVKERVVEKKVTSLKPRRYTDAQILEMAQYDLECNRLMCNRVVRVVAVPVLGFLVIAIIATVIIILL